MAATQPGRARPGQPAGRCVHPRSVLSALPTAVPSAGLRPAWPAGRGLPGRAAARVGGGGGAAQGGARRRARPHRLPQVGWVLRPLLLECWCFFGFACKSGGRRCAALWGTRIGASVSAVLPFGTGQGWQADCWPPPLLPPSLTQPPTPAWSSRHSSRACSSPQAWSQRRPSKRRRQGSHSSSSRPVVGSMRLRWRPRRRAPRRWRRSLHSGEDERARALE